MLQKLILLHMFACETPESIEDTGDDLKLDLPAEEEEPLEEELEEEPEEEFQIDADVTIDATDSTVWVYFDLESGTIVEPEIPEDSTEWDIKFQRYDIGVNGGVSGSDGVMVTSQDEVYDTFDDITTVPESEWVTDAEDSDGDEKPEYAFKDWFDYDISTHVLTPKNTVYFIQTSEQIYKFRIVDYYGPNSASGFMSFDVAPVTAE